MKTLHRIYTLAASSIGYKTIILVIFLIVTSHISAQTIKTTSTNTQSSLINELQTVQTDSFPEMFELSEKEINNIESYIPYSEPQSFPEDADWIFEIPIDVKNISPLVKEIVVNVKVYLDDQHLTTIFGTGGTRVELINGAYNGNTIIGVKYDPINMESPRLPHNAKRFLVGLYLSDGVSIKYPSRSQCTPLWRMADANQPFDIYDSGDIPERYGSEQ